jgi:hypothetical protein
MMFKVTHITLAGHRLQARVTAQSVADAMDQMERVFGEARGGAYVPMAARPLLRLVQPVTVTYGRHPCAV